MFLSAERRRGAQKGMLLTFEIASKPARVSAVGDFYFKENRQREERPREGS